MTLKGGTSQACAACKYQRRRCTQECPLAPYFPPDQPKLFHNAHKLFGVSNIVKILKNVSPEQKGVAMWSIIYQSNEREKNPVYGCLGRIHQLKYLIWQAEEELQAVLAQLEMCRQQHNHHQILAMPHDHELSQQLDLGMAPPVLNHPPAQPYGGMPMPYQNGENGATLMDSKDSTVLGNNMWVQYPYNNDPMHMQPLVSQTEQEVQDFEEMPLFDTIDDRQSYIDSKEANDSSSEGSVLKETQSFEHGANNELKSAAARFSLTSVK
ncbi:hypothetical protein UlMin_008058 [Ulmus minor]